MKIYQWKGTLVTTSLLFTFILAGCAGEESASENESEGESESESEATDDSDVTTLQLGHIATETNPYHLLAEDFKELVEERSDGRLEIEIYPNAQLGSDRELTEAMTFGNLDLGIVTTSPVTNFVPEFGVLDIPYLFEDWDQVETFIGSDIHQDLLAETEEIGIESYSLIPRGFRSVTTSTHPIETPEDMAGHTFRVIESEVYEDTINEMGGSATQMPWGDAFTAMEQGAIEGQENDFAIIQTQNVPEVQDYLSLTEHIFAMYVLMGSQASIEQLPEDLQEIIAESAVEASQGLAEHNREDAGNLLEMIEEEGMEVNEVDQEAFMDSVSETQQKYSEQYGESYYQDIEELLN